MQDTRSALVANTLVWQLRHHTDACRRRRPRTRVCYSVRPFFLSEIHSPFALSRAHQRRGLPAWSRVGLSTLIFDAVGRPVDSPIALLTCRLRFLAENGADMLAVDQRNGGLTPKMVMKAQFRYDPTVLLLFRITGSARSGTRLGTV